MTKSPLTSPLKRKPSLSEFENDGNVDDEQRVIEASNSKSKNELKTDDSSSSSCRHLHTKTLNELTEIELNTKDIQNVESIQVTAPQILKKPTSVSSGGDSKQPLNECADELKETKPLSLVKDNINPSLEESVPNCEVDVNQSSRTVMDASQASATQSQQVENDSLHSQMDDFYDCPSINDFEILKPISKGAFGIVHLCRRKRENGVKANVYAMKVMNKKDILDKNKIKDVYEEREILSSVQCPFIVSLHYFVQSSNYACFIMEYMVGGDLKNLVLCMRWFNDYMAAFYTAETALAIDYLHRLNIIHRDIKPDNMLISPSGHLKLTDFGLSQSAQFKRLHTAPEVFTPRGKQKMLRSQVLLKSFNSKIHFNQISETDTDEEVQLFSSQVLSQAQSISQSYSTDRADMRRGQSNDGAYFDSNATVIEANISSERIENDQSHDNINNQSDSETSEQQQEKEENLPVDGNEQSNEHAGIDPPHTPSPNKFQPYEFTNDSQGLRNDVSSSSTNESGAMAMSKSTLGTLFIPLFCAAQHDHTGNKPVIPNQNEDDSKTYTPPLKKRFLSDAVIDKSKSYFEQVDKFLQTSQEISNVVDKSAETNKAKSSEKYIVKKIRMRTEMSQKFTPLNDVDDFDHNAMMTKCASSSMIETTWHNNEADYGVNNLPLRGTPDYFAPELVDFSAHSNSGTKAIDWWALGCCLFEFLYGCPPFWDRTIDDVLSNIRNIRVEYDDSVSLNANLAIKRFLTQKPECRVDLKEMKHLAFFKCINFDNIQSMQPPFVPKPHDDEDVTNFQAVNEIRQL